jgi:hypothetical protein
MDYTKGNGLTTAVGSNGTSKTWRGTVTNRRGEILQEFIICNYVCVLKEATETPTVQHNREVAALTYQIATANCWVLCLTGCAEGKRTAQTATL